MKLEVPGVQTPVEQLDLIPGVVYVILALDVVSGGVENLGKRAADNRSSGMADVERSGWVDAHELDLHFALRADIAVSEPVALRDHRGDLILKPRRAHREVDEPRSRRPNALKRAPGGDLLGNLLGNRHRIHPHLTGELQRQRAGEIAVLGIIRPLDDGVIDLRLGQVALRLCLSEPGQYDFSDVVA